MTDLVDISPGWQSRAAKLFETIRTCKCDGEKLRNRSGVEFCATCGKWSGDEPRKEQVSTMDTADHFPTPEFSCRAYTAPDGHHPSEPYPAEWVTTRLPALKRTLEVIRLACGSHPIEIRCGYRSVAFNAELRRRGLEGEHHATGVALHSQHTEGRAADIAIYGMSAKGLHVAIHRAWAAGQLPELGGLALYKSLGFVHVDTYRLSDGRLREWVG